MRSNWARRRAHQRRVDNGHADVFTPKKTRFTREMVRELVSIIGIKATRALMEKGAHLHIWRNSSPHNWWVAPKNDEHEYIWHSDEYDRERPSLKMFCGVSDEGVVSYGNSIFQGSDAGMAQWSKYVINPKLKAVWNRMTPEMKKNLTKKIKWTTTK